MKTSRLRYLRQLAGLTLDELSLEIGINVPRLSRLERGYGKVRPREKEALSEFFSVAPEILFPLEMEKRR